MKKISGTLKLDQAQYRELEAFAKFGPGMLIHHHLISHLAGRGVSRFEFQGQLIDYKRRWTDLAVPTVALRIYPFTPRGAAAAR